MDISIHDNRLISYSVLSNKREIHLHTAFLDKEPFEFTDVIFSGVVAYHFECDNFQTIIFDIYEVEPKEIYDEYENLFSRLKNFGWLNINYDSKEDLMVKLKAGNIKAYNFHSSYGLFGWILAENMVKEKSE